MIKAANARCKQISVAEEVLADKIVSEGSLSSLLLRAGGIEKYGIEKYKQSYTTLWWGEGL